MGERDRQRDSRAEFLKISLPMENNRQKKVQWYSRWTVLASIAIIIHKESPFIFFTDTIVNASCMQDSDMTDRTTRSSNSSTQTYEGGGCGRSGCTPGRSGSSVLGLSTSIGRHEHFGRAGRISFAGGTGLGIFQVKNNFGRSCSRV